MTPEQRDAAMNEWERLKRRAANIQQELDEIDDCEEITQDEIDAVQCDLWDAEIDLSKIEDKFPECKHWPATTKASP